MKLYPLKNWHEVNAIIVLITRYLVIIILLLNFIVFVSHFTGPLVYILLSMALSATDSDFAIVIGIKQILINVLLSNIMFYLKKMRLN